MKSRVAQDLDKIPKTYHGPTSDDVPSNLQDAEEPINKLDLNKVYFTVSKRK